MFTFLDSLHSGRVLLMDGAMGTELQRAGLKDGEYGATWNVLHPERIRAVHDAYRSAGAKVLLTNTFLAENQLHKCKTLFDGRKQTNAWQMAITLIGPGPSTFRLLDHGPVNGNSVAREFDRPAQLRATLPLFTFVDGILLETCSTSRVRLALNVLRRECDCPPLLLSLTYLRTYAGQLISNDGHCPEWFAKRAARWGAAALGVNCGRDITIADCAEIVRRYRQVTDLPLFARPNAGVPSDRWVYPLTPGEMAEQLPELLEAGVSMVGGCCGTTPAHIAAMKPVVDDWNRRRRKTGKATVDPLKH